MDPSQLFFLHVEFPQYPSYGLPMQPALHEERGQVRATQAAAAVPSAYDVSRRTEIQLGGRHDFLTANPNVHFSRSENNFTRVYRITVIAVKVYVLYDTAQSNAFSVCM